MLWTFLVSMRMSSSLLHSTLLKLKCLSKRSSRIIFVYGAFLTVTLHTPLNFYLNWPRGMNNGGASDELIYNNCILFLCSVRSSHPRAWIQISRIMALPSLTIFTFINVPEIFMLTVLKVRKCANVSTTTKIWYRGLSAFEHNINGPGLGPGPAYPYSNRIIKSLHVNLPTDASQ